MKVTCACPEIVIAPPLLLFPFMKIILLSVIATFFPVPGIFSIDEKLSASNVEYFPSFADEPP
ncbi:MAG: hypothetical protein Q4Q24_03670 [Methanobrevibacter ruminantium]|uniref:hypothetical protein n=1 Tax=Methanobrevibacter ruminantium TaxID=83816 RepID=UPI0026F2815B|nr:hypothetical protein [Methanobrevibacter ruminantium]MDO5842343.1 hypothetical protein [Methanobrevibacter ruminantium]